MKNFKIEERIKIAVSYFESGHNCAQAVFLAYCDILGMDANIAKKMTVSFGGGIGRMRETCGAINAIAMLTGFKYPVPDTKDQEARTRNYTMVQKATNIFKKNHGTILCRELLEAHTSIDTNPVPSIRDNEYYSKRPCIKIVAEAAEIAGKMLKGELEDV